MSDRKTMVVVIDIESTGIDTRTAKLVQLGAVAMDPETGRTQVLFNSNSNPGIPIPDGAREVHGISDEDVRWSPTNAMVIRCLDYQLAVLSRAFDLILAGYNSDSYDIPVLKNLCADRHIYGLPTLDAFRLAARMNLPTEGLKLTQVYKHVSGKEPVNAHDATADCYMTAKILFHQMEHFKMRSR